MGDTRAAQDLGTATACILSGGEARRAGGVNKSFIPIEGRPIIERQLERLGPLFGGRILIITDRPDDFAPYDLDCRPDIDANAMSEGKFALRGVASAFAACPTSWCFLLAGDMPWPDPDIIVRQFERLTNHTGSAPFGLCFETANGPEPFHAFYQSSLADSAARSASGGDRSLRAWIRGIDRIERAGPESLGLAPSALERCLTNINARSGEET